MRRIGLTTLLVISSFGANDLRPAHADRPEQTELTLEIGADS